jgi:hypothetical protein
MKTELKRMIAFGVIISLLTSTYATFLGTILKQGLFTVNFVSNWIALIPKAYLAMLPFVLLTGPLVTRIVNAVFGPMKTKPQS